MIEQIIAQPAWFWLCFGGLLLIAELLGASGYLLWTGIAALIVTLLVWLIPTISWEWQGIIFAIMTIVTVVLWRNWLRSHTRNEKNAPNQRNQQMIGVRGHLLSPTQDGYSRIKLADGSWRVYSEHPLPIHTEVEIVGIDGITLLVKAVITDNQ